MSPISMVIAVRSSSYTDQCGVGAQSACTSQGKSKMVLGLDLSKEVYTEYYLLFIIFITVDVYVCIISQLWTNNVLFPLQKQKTKKVCSVCSLPGL